MAPTITWQDNSDNETGFVLERQLNGGPFTAISMIARDVVSYTDATAVGSTLLDNVYCYRVKAFNEVGESVYSNVGCITIPKIPAPAPSPTIPAMPTGLEVMALSSSEIRIFWNDQSNNEMGFQVERVANGVRKLLQYVRDQVTAVDSGLRRNTWHEYRIRALGAAGPSPWTNKVRVKTLR